MLALWLTKDILENGVYAGNPAKYICETQSYIAKHKNKMNELNTFSSAYTIQQNITEKMKKEIKESVNRFGQIFIK